MTDKSLTYAQQLQLAKSRLDALTQLVITQTAMTTFSLSDEAFDSYMGGITPQPQDAPGMHSNPNEAFTASQLAELFTLNFTEFADRVRILREEARANAGLASVNDDKPA